MAPINTITVVETMEGLNRLNTVFGGQCLSGTAAPGTTTNIDYKLTEDFFFSGGEVLTKGSVFGDKIALQVVDVDGVKAPPGYVLSTFVQEWAMVEDSQKQMNYQGQYPAKILAGMAIRAVYKSTGTTPVQVAFNMSLHKVLT